MSRSPIPVVIGLAALAGGCGASEPSPSPGDEEACEVQVEGKTLFIGTPECLSQLPKRRMSGVWVLGHEYSVFYEGRRSGSELPAGSYSDVWLHAKPSKVLPAHGLQFDGNTRAYRVEFIGTISDAPGVYGNGMYKRGALVLQMLRLDEIPLSRPSRS